MTGETSSTRVRGEAPDTQGERKLAARLASSWRGGPMGARNFRLLSLGQLTSTVGDFCYAVALPWMILSTRGGTVLLGVVLACYGIPRTVLIPVGGVLADKLGARTVMLTSDAIRCVLVAALALLAARHEDSLALLGPVAALLGAGEGAFLPASFSIMPTILPTESLAAGNALSTGMVQVGSLAGPVLGGLIVTTAGPSSAFAVDAASFAVSAAALALMRKRAAPGAAAAPATAADSTTPDSTTPDSTTPDSTTPDSTTAAAASGVWALLRRSRLLQVILAVCVAANLTSGGTFDVALPALAHDRFGAAGYGLLLGCFGAGSVIGTLAGGRSGSLRRPAVVAFSAFVIEAALVTLMPFFGLGGAAGMITAFGLCNGFGNVISITLLQKWAPGHLLGRVMSLVMLAGIGSFPASVAAAGVLVRHLGPTPFFPICGIVLGVTALAGLAQREIRDFGARPKDGTGQAGPEPPGQAAVVAAR